MAKSKDTEEFKAFWKAYPRKVGKGAARKSFARALKDGATLEEITEGVANYVRDISEQGTATHFICHPTTWLNQERWEDEYEFGGDTRSPRERAVDEGRERILGGLALFDQWAAGPAREDGG